MKMPEPFAVDAQLLSEVRALIGRLVARSSSSAFTVPATEFPAWLAALGKGAFYAHTTKSGMRFIRAGYAVIGDWKDPDAPIVTVTCDQPPAPWVTFPETEGDRRYLFRYNISTGNAETSR